jgi:hypothetical protein
MRVQVTVLMGYLRDVMAYQTDTFTTYPFKHAEFYVAIVTSH